MSEARATVANVTPDLSKARAYLAALTGEDDPVVTYQTFSDHKPSPVPAGWRDPLARILHGTLARHAAELERLNAAGAGIFAMANAGDLKGRRDENVRAVRAAFIDLDKPAARPCALPPSFAVLTSPQKGHAYWRIRGELPLANFRAVQKRLIAFYGSDTSVHELCRVMRLPGFFHRKGEPVLVEFEMGSGEAYTADEILFAHPPVLVPRVAHATPRRATSSTDEDGIVRERVLEVADGRSWAEGSRHESARCVSVYALKLGMECGDVASIVADYLERAGKSRDEADAIVKWAGENVSPIPADREKVVRSARRQTEGAR